MLDIFGHFVGQGTRVVLVTDPLKQKAVLLRKGFSSEEIRGVCQAWTFIEGAFQSEADKSILKRCKSPREAVDHLEEWFDPESEVAIHKLYDEFHDFTTPSTSNTVEALHSLDATKNQMTEKGMGTPDTFLHARFVCALPNEHDYVKATLQVMKNRHRAEIIRMIGTRYSTLPQKKGSQQPSRPPEQAVFSSESAGQSGARRGRGRGGSSSKGGGRSSGGGSSSARSANGSSHGGGSRPPRRCWRCNRRDHIREECTMKESNSIAECARCLGFGHEESICSSDAEVLVMELAMSEEDLAVEAQALGAREIRKCSLMVGEEVGMDSWASRSCNISQHDARRRRPYQLQRM